MLMMHHKYSIHTGTCHEHKAVVSTRVLAHELQSLVKAEHRWRWVVADVHFAMRDCCMFCRGCSPFGKHMSTHTHAVWFIQLVDACTVYM